MKNNRKTFNEQKPKRFEGHLVYACPECECDNYITLSEAMTEGFMIVCPDCNSILRPQFVTKMKVYYDEKKVPPVPKQTQPVFNTPESRPEKSEPMPKLEDFDPSNNNNILPDHDYMQDSKFTPLENTFEINVLTDEQIYAITESVKVLKKYGYSAGVASKLASDCMRENCADLTIDKKKLLELVLRKEGAKLNE
jgi:DNA-directed RNA polymerase subunit RPC12/RpoP